MKEETVNCKNCTLKPPMTEVGGIGKQEEMGEWEKNGKLEDTPIIRWIPKGIREIKLYQCPECKTIILK